MPSMSKVDDVTGKRFGRLVVSERSGTYKARATWLCQCDCGKTTIVTGHDLRSGETTSCGCYKLTRHRKHGQYRTPEFAVWVQIRQRCNNPTCHGYPNYGGRGISVCERWNDFSAFIEDMGPKPSPIHSIDRTNNDGNYEPGNCTWAIPTTQSRNRRVTRQVTAFGETKCVAEWTSDARCNVSAAALGQRLRNGMNAEQAITMPRQVGIPPRRYGVGGGAG